MPTKSDILPKKKFSAPCAVFVCQHREEILENWIDRIKSDIPSARTYGSSILVDTLPLFLEKLAEALDVGLEVSPSKAENNVAEEHGGERARVTDFEPSQVVKEYIILRSLVLKALKSGASPTPYDLNIIYTFFDEAIQQAMMAYYYVLNSIRGSVLNYLTHDIRTPLSSAKLSLDLIQRITAKGDVSPESILRLCKVALKNIDYANDLIEQMLDADHFRTKSVLIVPQFAQVDVMELASNCISEMASISESRIELTGENVLAYVDVKAFRRALENLIANAVKYGNEKSPISVKVSTSNDRLLLSVHNYGPVIPIEKRGMIFNSRHRLVKDTEEIKGWGLGLAYCRSVAEKHAGSIGVQSSAESGTTFTIDVPIDPRGLEISRTW